MFILAANFFTSSGGTSSFPIPITCNSAPYFDCSATRLGISTLQGPHQVAQKFTTVTLPREAETETGLPSTPGSWKSGAGCGSLTNWIVGASADGAAAAATPCVPKVTAEPLADGRTAKKATAPIATATTAETT